LAIVLRSGRAHFFLRVLRLVTASSSQEYLGQYRLLNLLHAGKTGKVWEAISDLKGGQKFAVKMLLKEFSKDKTEIGYLKREYEVGRLLDHPRCIHVYDLGTSGDNVYLAFEYWPAPNIKQNMQQLGMDKFYTMLSKVVTQAAEGLAHFHTKGWVHRDIKPENYLMNAAGDVKLIDFALAQKMRKGLAKLIPDFSKSSAIQGTQSYMSPEQIRNESLDERADVYSFGCMLFELSSGKLPFTGMSTSELLNKHLKAGPPPLQSANKNVSDQFANLVKRMLAKKADDRPANMSEFLREFYTMKIFKT
jgi:eukaryotic-like serine/threonine-protein kinase